MLSQYDVIADGAEIQVPVPLYVSGHGEVHQKSTLDEDLDRLFVTRASTKTDAYKAKAWDYDINWNTLEVNIDGKDTELQIAPSIVQKEIAITDEDGNVMAQPKERMAVLETDTNYSYIDARVSLVTVEDWPMEDDIGKFVEFKKVDHANRRLIDVE